MVNHPAFATDRVHVAVYRRSDEGWTGVAMGASQPVDPMYGSGIDGDIVLDGGTHSLESLIPRYDGWTRTAEVRSLVLRSGAVLTVADYDGQAMGRVMVRAQQRIEVCATCAIDVSGGGYRGGAILPVNSSVAGIPGQGPGGGGAADRGNNCGHGGGGGGGAYGGNGAAGTPDLDRCNPTGANELRWSGAPGVQYGDPTIRTVFMGSGGGSSSEGHDYVTNIREPGAGGAGGGAVALWAPVIDIAGSIVASGEQGTPFTPWGTDNPQVASGGGGAGGSIRLQGVVVNAAGLSAVGGVRGIGQGWGSPNNRANGQRGGAGGVGRIYIARESGAGGLGSPAPVVHTAAPGQYAAVEACGYTTELVDDTTAHVHVDCTLPSQVRVVLTALQ